MGIPLLQKIAVGSYVVRQALRGKTRYPLVLMLEPLFKCNLSCAGCGKIDYPPEVMNRYLSLEDCLGAAEECGAPVVSIPGGEPLLHPHIKEIVQGLVEMKRFVYLCTNGILLKDRLGDFTPSPYLTLSVHLDGLRGLHDRIVSRPGVFDTAVDAIREATRRGFRVTTNTTLFEGTKPEEAARFFDFVTGLGVEGMTVSPGFSYRDAKGRGKGEKERFFLSRESTRGLFRTILGMAKERDWTFNQSGVYLDFLSGNLELVCSPWGTPTRNIFGWQRPCYLINEGYAGTYRELVEETDWERYGREKNPKCRDCMVHCGYEPTAVLFSVKNPLKALLSGLKGVDAA